MRRANLVWLILLCCAVSGWGQDTNSVQLSDSQAVQVLTSLLPPGKKSATLQVLILGNWVKNEDTGTLCTADGTVYAQLNSDNTVSGHTRDTQECSDTYHHSRILRFAVADPQDRENAVYVIDSAVFPKGLTRKQMGIGLATLGYGAIFMHPQGQGKLLYTGGPSSWQTYGVVLARDKHGQFDVYMWEPGRVGGKGKVTRFPVMEVHRVVAPTKPTGK